MTASGRKRRKRITYRDLAGRSLEAHANHWRGFTFTGGPWKVEARGPFGAPQVWASSEAEGRRVIGHCGAIAGWNLSAPNVEWTVVRISDQRLGKGGTFRVSVKRGLLMVSKRDGPSGAPESLPA